jgi:hypothetical protein
MLSHRDRGLRQVEHLTALHPGHPAGPAAQPGSGRTRRAHAAIPGPAGSPAPASCPHARPARPAYGRSSSAATAATACPALRWTAAGRSYAVSAAPQAQRSAPGPVPAPQPPAPGQPATLPAPPAAKPPKRPAPHLRNRHHHQAHPDVTTTRHAIRICPVTVTKRPPWSSRTVLRIAGRCAVSSLPGMRCQAPARWQRAPGT